MLRAAVDHGGATEHADGPCCAAAVLITLHKQSNTATATAAAPGIGGVVANQQSHSTPASSAQYICSFYVRPVVLLHAGAALSARGCGPIFADLWITPTPN